MPSNFEKPLQTAGRTRKKSIFARKSSETTVSKPDTGGVVILDYSRTRKKRGALKIISFHQMIPFLMLTVTLQEIKILTRSRVSLPLIRI